MDKVYEKAYEKVIDYIETNILDGNFEVGDKLPSERELSQMLSVSRNSVREGIRILEIIGVISSQHGIGNYVADHFDKTLVQVMTMMYALEKMTYNEIKEFRYAVELQALVLAMDNISDVQKDILRKNLDILEHSDNEEEKVISDKQIHYTIVEASGNRLVIANYLALAKIMEGFIRDMRSKILKGETNSDDFQATHRHLVEAICNNDLELGKKALDEHFVYICQNMDT
ncbi:MAG: FadR/GntR family transcriptional regulator [Coprococcus sp.]